VYIGDKFSETFYLDAYMQTHFSISPIDVTKFPWGWLGALSPQLLGRGAIIPITPWSRCLWPYSWCAQLMPCLWWYEIFLVVTGYL